MRTARADPTPWLCRNTMISRTTFCSAQAVAMRFARTRSDAVHFPQAVRLRLDDVEYLVAESSQQFLGVDRPDAPDHARGKILLDAFEGCRGRGLEEPGLELLTMSAVIRPVTRGRDPLTGGNDGGMANDRDEIAVTTRLHPDNAKAVLGVLVGDALNQPSKHLPVGWLWLRLHDAHRTGPRRSGR